MVFIKEVSLVKEDTRVIIEHNKENDYYEQFIFMNDLLMGINKGYNSTDVEQFIKLLTKNNYEIEDIVLLDTNKR